MSIWQNSDILNNASDTTVVALFSNNSPVVDKVDDLAIHALFGRNITGATNLR